MVDQPGREAHDGRLSDTPEPALEELADRLQAVALALKVTLATAESCTGGLVGHCLTQIPGSSGYYRGGVVSYADELKVGLLDVAPSTIDGHGAVSAQVAVAMAQGVRLRTGAAYGISVTGIAGPDGGTAAKPVGLTYVAAAGPEGHAVRRYVWTGDRASNKRESARAAIELAIAMLEGTPGTSA